LIYLFEQNDSSINHWGRLWPSRPPVLGDKANSEIDACCSLIIEILAQKCSQRVADEAKL